jgi:glycosyltransferase involved in cell wall biosynthesis
MATIKKTILHLTPFFPPNIGGVETHLSDLVKETSKEYKIIVLTYSPITTKAKYKTFEKSKNIEIHRYPWIGGNLFHKFEKHPIINLIYLTPYLLIRSILFLLSSPKKIDTIHSHGINSAIIGIFLKNIFKIKKHISSIYSTYDNVPLNSFGTKFMVYVLNKTDKVLTQSLQSQKQLIKLGVKKEKIDLYRHWIDLKQFKPQKINKKIFSIIFIGRLIPQKGALLLAKIATRIPKINFLFVGDGPDYQKLKQYSKKYKNIKLYGNIPYAKLQQYYNLANAFCIPSLYKEGWGRVIMEALACGLPVIASNKGAITEVINSSVGIIVKPTFHNLKEAILKMQKDYQKYQKNCRPYALKNFSTKSVSLITKYY